MASGTEWYYKAGGEQVGPVTQEALCALFKGRALGPETMVWGAAFRRWVPAASIAGFRAVCGVEEGGPGTGGVLDHRLEDEEPEAWELGGWLFVPAIFRVIVPAYNLLVAAGLYFGGEVLRERGVVKSAGMMQVAGIVVAIVGVYELWASSLFFGRRRAAVPALVLGWVVWGGLAVLMAAAGWGRRPGEVGGTWWPVASVAWSVVWVWYFSVSERVKATFVR